MKKTVSIRDLKNGDILEESVKDSNDVDLVTKGTVLSDGVISRLRRMYEGRDIFVTIDDGTNEIDPNDLEEVKDKSIQYLREVFASSDDDSKEKLEQLQSVVSKMAIGLEDISKIPVDVIEEGHSQAGEHYYRVARLAMAIASIYNKSVTDDKKISLESIGMAALLHDYGKKFNKKNNSKNLKIVSSVCESLDDVNTASSSKPHQTYAYITLRGKVDSDVRRMILFSSYSDSNLRNSASASEKSCVQATRIIKLCDTYDSLLDKISRRGISSAAERVVDYMGEAASEGNISEEFYNIFFTHLPMYSNGMKVLLSNDVYAVVVEKNDDDPTKPVVLTLNDGYPKLINLSDDTGIEIKCIVKKAQKTSDESDDYLQGKLADAHASLDSMDFISQIIEEPKESIPEESESKSFTKKISGLFARMK